MKRDEHYNNNISNILARIAWYYGGPILARAHPPFRGFHNDWEQFGHALSYVHRRAGEDVHRHANCRGINTCTWLHNYQSLHFTVIHAFLFSIHFLFHHTNQPTNRPINQSINYHLFTYSAMVFQNQWNRRSIWSKLSPADSGRKSCS